MGHGLPLPSEEHLQALIRETFDGLPGPERDRLHALRDELLRRRVARPRQGRWQNLPWWVIGLLAAGVATAGWWLGGGFTTPPETSTVSEQPAPQASSPQRQDAERRRQTKAVESPVDEPATERTRSPIIYQREGR